MKKNIILIGMPGVGKSTVGVVLAKVMGYRRYSRYKKYDNPWYIHTRNEAEIFCKQMEKQYKDYQLIIEKYKIADWKDYFDIVDYLDDNNINYIVYA